MKKRYIFTACVLALAMIGLCGCQKAEEKAAPEQETPKEQILNPDSSEQTPEQDALNPNSSEEIPKDIVIAEISYAAPDYEYQLYLSDDVILGEVIQTLEGRYSNPDDSIPGLMNAWITPYVVRVDKSYRGVLTEGDTVVVCTWNKLGIYPGDENQVVIENEREFYLHDGQRGVFMLELEDAFTTDDNQPMYEVVFQNEGLFEPKETDVAPIGQDASVVYASPSFEVTLDQIPEDIKRADEQYGK